MSLPYTKTERVNLSTAEVMLACGDPEGLNILAEMFAGFGVHTPRRCLTGAEARTSINERILNLIVVDSALQDQTGYDFIHWLRRCDVAPNCYAPVILLTGHTKPSQIFKGRDAGASFVVRKPVAPMVMMQRILWLLNDQRKFVTSPGYCGPDRRVKALGPPVGMKGRRHDDLSAEVGAASTPNLGQDEIDALFKPKAVI
ncbi:response regulator transcription factor [Phenylobacterium sp.]|uniref:response regulator transcription factor n=1 Tax=Phenylobacterium sp. TaxID=1871053 RepID=UPI00120C0921|nr:response regulator [Phenylobacterium sp.]TAL31463.1 MAG: response regulator [Phenylobacterium sp.]